MDVDTGLTVLAAAVSGLAAQLGLYNRLLARMDAVEARLTSHIDRCNGVK